MHIVLFASLGIFKRLNSSVDKKLTPMLETYIPESHCNSHRNFQIINTYILIQLIKTLLLHFTWLISKNVTSYLAILKLIHHMFGCLPVRVIQIKNTYTLFALWNWDGLMPVLLLPPWGWPALIGLALWEKIVLETQKYI